MQIDNPDPRSTDRIQKVLSKDVHPPRQHNQIRLGLALENLVGQRRIVPVPRLSHLLGGVVRLCLKAMRQQVEILPGDAGLLGALGGVRLAPVDDELDDARVWDLAACDGVNEGLEVGAIPAGHDQDVALL